MQKDQDDIPFNQFNINRVKQIEIKSNFCQTILQACELMTIICNIVRNLHSSPLLIIL